MAFLPAEFLEELEPLIRETQARLLHGEEARQVRRDFKEIYIDKLEDLTGEYIVDVPQTQLSFDVRQLMSGFVALQRQVVILLCLEAGRKDSSDGTVLQASFGQFLEQFSEKKNCFFHELSMPKLRTHSTR